MPSALRTRRVVLNLAALHLVATFLFAVLHFLFGQPGRGHLTDWYGGATFGCGAAQATLLAAAIALGSYSPRLRLALGVVGSLALLLAYRIFVGDPFAWIGGPADYSGYVTATLAPSLVGGFALGTWARSRGWKWAAETSPHGPPVRFSIREVLLATAFIALLLGAARWLHDHLLEFAYVWTQAGPLGNWLTADAVYELLLGSALALASLAGAVACIGPRPVLRYVLGTLVWTLSVGLAWSWATEFEHHGAKTSGGLAAVLVAAVAVMISLLMLRAGGWRIDRPTATLATDGRDELNIASVVVAEKEPAP
ncbi:MAG TPA: hypothetical protein VGE52_16590 [Pirellulales bacterium]